MPGTPGARTGLATILGTDTGVTIYRSTVNAIISWLEGNAMLTSAGLLSARPASTSASPGIPGRKYYATDLGLEFRDTGTSWVPVGIPIGGLVEFAGAGDLTAELVLADGRTLTSSAYATLDAMFGAAASAGRTHAYNGGASPGSGLFRLPDLRGRSSVGPDDMGTAQGAASRIPNSNRTLGQSGGEERHTMTAAEMLSHSHLIPTRIANAGLTVDQASAAEGNSDQPMNAYASRSSSRGSIASTGSNGSSQPFNVMQPYVITNRLIRIL